MEPQENADAYQKMAIIIQGAFEQLLAPLRTIAPAQLLESTTAETFFQNFLIQADGFAEKSSQEFAKTIREFSIVPEVRGTPTVELAEKIRGACFEKLDRILASYVAALKDLNLDLTITSSQLAGSSVIDAALHGAAVGQLAGGLGRAGKKLGTFYAIWKGVEELVAQGTLEEQQLELLKMARRLPYEKIAEFLKTAAGLPEELLDYGCAKCFGGQVDFARQREVVESVSGATSSKLQEAVTSTETLPSVEEEVMRKKAAIEAEKVAVEAEKVAVEAIEAEQNLKSTLRRGCAVCLGSVAVVALIVGFVAMASGENGNDRERGFVAVIVAIVFGLAAVLVYDKPPKPKEQVAVPQ